MMFEACYGHLKPLMNNFYECYVVKNSYFKAAEATCSSY